MKLSRKLASKAGSTLLEAVITMGIVAVFLSGIYEMNWRTLTFLKSSNSSACAGRALQDRLETMRSSNWTQMTNADYIKNSILNTVSNDASDLESLSEKISVTAYPPGKNYNGSKKNNKAAAPITVVRTADGNVNKTLGGDGTMNQEDLVRVDVSITWVNTFGGQSHTRQTSTLVAAGGITGRNK